MSGALVLTSAEAAALLQISERTLKRHKAAGDIAFVQFGGRLVRYRREDVLAFRDARVRRLGPTPRVAPPARTPQTPDWLLRMRAEKAAQANQANSEQSRKHRGGKS